MTVKEVGIASSNERVQVVTLTDSRRTEGYEPVDGNDVHLRVCMGGYVGACVSVGVREGG